MTHFDLRFAALAASIAALALGACATDDATPTANETGDSAAANTVFPVNAAVETAPVASNDDAADDMAIWVHPSAPEKSLILGTDKRAGLHAYDLDGASIDFLPLGRLNNVDLRQGVTLGAWTGDLAAASNRSNDTVALIAVDEDGLESVGSFPVDEPQPYGLCVGVDADGYLVFVANKTGRLSVWRVFSLGQNASMIADIAFDTQLEGCVYDDAAAVLFVGEENRGVWKVALDAGVPAGLPTLVDEIGGASGIVADVEGLALYRTGETSGYLLASSQGNNTYAVYDREGDNTFLGRFAIVTDDASGIDGSEETDGIDATAANLGPNFPKGVFIAQDGYNDPSGSNQNFKIVDWRLIEDGLTARQN